MIVTFCKFIKGKFTNGKFCCTKKCLKEDVKFITSYNTSKKTMFYSATKRT